MGSLPTPRMMNCHECGRLIDEESQFCQCCGHELPSEERKTEQERSEAKLGCHVHVGLDHLRLARAGRDSTDGSGKGGVRGLVAVRITSS